MKDFIGNHNTKKKPQKMGLFSLNQQIYIMPGIPPPIPPISGIAGAESCGISVTIASVVIIKPEILAAC
jgi:hypothetical protein